MARDRSRRADTALRAAWVIQPKDDVEPGQLRQLPNLRADSCHRQFPAATSRPLCALEEKRQAPGVEVREPRQVELDVPLCRLVRDQHGLELPDGCDVELAAERDDGSALDHLRIDSQSW